MLVHEVTCTVRCLTKYLQVMIKAAELSFFSCHKLLCSPRSVLTSHGLHPKSLSRWCSSPSWSTQKLSPGKLHWFMLIVGTASLADHRGVVWNKDAFLCGLWCKFLGNWFLVHLTVNTFVLVFKLLWATFHFKNHRKEQFGTFWLWSVGYWIHEWWIDMMKCYCIRVFRRDAGRIGKLVQFVCVPSPWLCRVWAVQFNVPKHLQRDFPFDICYKPHQTMYWWGLRILCCGWGCPQWVREGFWISLPRLKVGTSVNPSMTSGLREKKRHLPLAWNDMSAKNAENHSTGT